MTITGFFTRDHREIEGLFAAFKDSLAQGHPNGALLAQIQERLHRHIYWEEDILFPAVASQGIMGPTQVMAEEHGEICSLLDRLGNLLKGGAPATAVEHTLAVLEEVLWSHNQKEEGILYPASDQVIDPAASRTILERVQHEGTPQGWACRAHRR